MDSRSAKGDDFLDRIRRDCDLQKIDAFVAQLVTEGMADELAKRFIERAPLESDLTVIEGHALSFGPIEDALTRALESRGGMVWEVSRAEPGGGR